MVTTTKEVKKLERNLPPRSLTDNQWLKNKNWDLAFISLSIVLVPIPYITWLILGAFTDSNFGRQAVNFAIAIFIGGPHMVATFSRTTLDNEFRTKYPKFIASSFIIPLIVVSIALTNMSLLLTIFFFIASIHVLHQITWIVESYNRKERDPKYQQKIVNGEFKYSWKESLTNPNNLIDYAFVLTSLYPIAAYRIAVTQDFDIGFVSLNDTIPSFFEQPWLFYLASGVFGMATVVFAIKSIFEYVNKTINLPKFIFIVSTATAAFIAPALPNLDTSFQGLNFWHSFQYLALTWYANKLRKEHGKMEHTPFFKKMSGDGKAKIFYGWNLLLTGGVGLIIGIVYIVLRAVGGIYGDSSYAFEVAYYIGVLSVLWQHYYHDHFLFTQTDTLVP